ncbi:MAG: formylglycine-generating enzyme family protein [Acidobacteria bacterium]|nr:formylglycine-generating enzyme family protein [Acidobacteriota bacterium]
MAAQPERVRLEPLLNRAAWYLDYFIDEFENVVAEENYAQDSNASLPTFIAVGGGRGGAPTPIVPTEMGRTRHRDLRSDFLLVKSPDTSALIPFRDVLVVDGIPVRDRQERLARLFLNGNKDAMAQAAQIREESARYNLGNLRTTIGNPVLGLSVLQRSYQSRFRFTLGKDDKSAGAGVWIVEYKEVESPAMVQGEAGRDLFAHGRLWIDALTGTVLKTEFAVEQPSVRAVVTTTFRVDDKSAIAVPIEMRELYTLANGYKVTTVARYGRFRRFAVSAGEDIHTPAPTFVDTASSLTFVELPAGRFTMGSASGEAGRNADETLHDVEVTRPFLLGQFEVTQQEWRAVMGASPSQNGNCARCPVENVSFFDVQQFLAKLNANPSATLRYRLPTEAQWEYACRARTTGPFSTGENLTTAEANYNGKFPYASFPAGESRGKTVPVGSFALSPWGLADMHGNVWEWTADWYGPYSESAAVNIDATGSVSGDTRVIRGGSFMFDANSARCALRYTHAPQDKGPSLGFRVAADRK